MKIQLIGYQYISEHRNASPDDYGDDHDSGHKTYQLYFKGDNKLFKVDVCESYGSCPSGYCGASWGNISRINEVVSIPENLVKTKEDVFIELLPNEVLNTTFDCPEEYYDSTIERLMSTDGIEIAYSTGNGGCQWYSSGSASINKELFN